MSEIIWRRKIDWRLLLGSLGLVTVAAIIGGWLTAGSIEPWYAGLTKPALAPPNWVFGPVWTVLYATMGIAFYLATRNRFGGAPVTLYLSQLLLNVVWSYAFFYSQSPSTGLAVIVALNIAIIATIEKFYRRSKIAAYMMVPYLLWVLFATYLNYQIYVLN